MVETTQPLEIYSKQKICRKQLAVVEIRPKTVRVDHDPETRSPLHPLSLYIKIRWVADG
jgi:hypothetical protein